MILVCAQCRQQLGNAAVRGNHSELPFCDEHCGRAYNSHLVAQDRSELVRSEHAPAHLLVPRFLAAAIDAHMCRLRSQQRIGPKTEPPASRKRSLMQSFSSAEEPEPEPAPETGVAQRVLTGRQWLMDAAHFQEPTIAGGGEIGSLDERRRQLERFLELRGVDLEKMYARQYSTMDTVRLLDLVVAFCVAAGDSRPALDYVIGSKRPFSVAHMFGAAICGGTGAEFLVVRLVSDSAFQLMLLQNSRDSGPGLYHNLVRFAVWQVPLISPAMVEALLDVQWVRIALGSDLSTTGSLSLADATRDIPLGPGDGTKLQTILFPINYRILFDGYYKTSLKAIVVRRETDADPALQEVPSDFAVQTSQFVGGLSALAKANVKLLYQEDLTLLAVKRRAITIDLALSHVSGFNFPDPAPSFDTDGSVLREGDIAALISLLLQHVPGELCDSGVDQILGYLVAFSGSGRRPGQPLVRPGLATLLSESFPQRWRAYLANWSRWRVLHRRVIKSASMYVVRSQLIYTDAVALTTHFNMLASELGMQYLYGGYTLGADRPLATLSDFLQRIMLVEVGHKSAWTIAPGENPHYEMTRVLDRLLIQFAMVSNYTTTRRYLNSADDAGFARMSSSDRVHCTRAILIAFFITWPVGVAARKALALFGSIMEYIGAVAVRKPPGYELQFYIDAFIKNRHHHYQLAVSLNPFRSHVITEQYLYAVSRHPSFMSAIPASYSAEDAAALSVARAKGSAALEKYRYEEMVARMCPWNTIKSAALFLLLIDALEQQFRMSMAFSDEYAELWPKLFGAPPPPATLFEGISKWGDGVIKRFSEHPTIGKFVTKYMDTIDRGGFLDAAEIRQLQRLKQKLLTRVAGVIEPPLDEFLAQQSKESAVF